MINITIEFYLSGKTIEKSFDTQEQAKRYIINIKGEGFCAYLNDGSFALYIP